ncbi:MAG: alpha/beta fold hydrolase, partial [Pseudomonadota bacterium]
MTPTTFPTTKGHRLTGTFFAPESPERAVVIHAATGVPAAFYHPFATWLMESHGARVLTYDYRDFGASATGPAKASRATMADWGVDDQSAALDHLIAGAGELPVWSVGHSLGGFMVPFHARADRLERHIAIASGPAFHWHHPWRFVPQALALWFLIGPPATALLGYLPGRRIGLGADLPAGVYWQWRRWCTAREFYRLDFGRGLEPPDLSRLTARVDLVAISDDVMIPPRVVARLAEFFPEGASTFRE